MLLTGHFISTSRALTHGFSVHRDVSGLSMMYERRDSICLLAVKCLFKETLHLERRKWGPAEDGAADLVTKQKSGGLFPGKMTFLAFCWGDRGMEEPQLPLPLHLPHHPPCASPAG